MNVPIRFRRAYRGLLLWRLHATLTRLAEQQAAIVRALPETHPEHAAEKRALLDVTASLVRSGRALGFDHLGEVRRKRESSDRLTG